MLTIGSLCTGIAGLDLAVARHFGATPIWMSENNKRASEFLAARYPDVPNLGDLRKVDSSQLEAPDILTAGWPCQSVSGLGSKLGPEDDRWLFDHIVEFVKNLPARPNWMVFENVQRLLSHDKGRTARGVVGAVAAMGYSLRWGVLRASEAGLPHLRARWFCVATDASRLESQRRGERGELAGPPEEDRRQRVQGQGVADLRTAPVHRPETAAFGKFAPAINRWWDICGRPPPDPLIDDRLNSRFVEWLCGYEPGYICDVFPGHRTSLRLLGNSVMPPQAELALAVLTTPPVL